MRDGDRVLERHKLASVVSVAAILVFLTLEGELVHEEKIQSRKEENFPGWVETLRKELGKICEKATITTPVIKLTGF